MSLPTTDRLRKKSPLDLEIERLAEELKAKHGADLYILQPIEHKVFARRPSRAVWARFRAAIRARDEFAGMENLLLDCVVHPSQEELDTLLDQFPAFVETFGNQLSKIAGLEEEAAAKKL